MHGIAYYNGVYFLMRGARISWLEVQLEPLHTSTSRRLKDLQFISLNDLKNLSLGIFPLVLNK